VHIRRIEKGNYYLWIWVRESGTESPFAGWRAGAAPAFAAAALSTSRRRRQLRLDGSLWSASEPDARLPFGISPSQISLCLSRDEHFPGENHTQPICKAHFSASCVLYPVIKPGGARHEEIKPDKDQPTSLMPFSGHIGGT